MTFSAFWSSKGRSATTPRAISLATYAIKDLNGNESISLRFVPNGP